MKNKSNIDIVKAICCVLIVGSHALPIFMNDTVDYYYGQCFFRFCVPFYFIASGYFFRRMDAIKKKRYILRIAGLYVFAALLYLPEQIKEQAGGFNVTDLLLGFQHTWYLCALAIGLVLLTGAEKCLKGKKYWLLLLYLPGLWLDEYYRLFDGSAVATALNNIFEYNTARNGLFFALPMLLVGERIAEVTDDGDHRLACVSVSAWVGVLAACFGLGLLESMFLRSRLGYVTMDLSFFCWTPAVPLMMICLKTKSLLPAPVSRLLRKTTDIVYIIHMYVLIDLNRSLGIYNMKAALIAVGISAVIGLALVVIVNKIKERRRAA